ncbi:MAG: UDP-N-acetylmuramoyl-tripeptide--D-alanyl-D-alanine ligase [Clostridia bacterium]|nr:UDP-N-acetylmuramoyl-tripeptide--D-alanyl-D-alanine ligase [Clostridia bacterium]
MNSILQILYGLSVLLGYYAVFRMTLSNLHMFQLNGYRTDTQLAWFKKNFSKYTVNVLLLPVAALFWFVSGEIFPVIAAVALNILYCAVLPANRKTKAKKPLVWTPRVKRMTATAILLYAVCMGLSFFTLTTGKFLFAYGIIALNVALCPILILVANGLNQPMEKGINARYTREAKRMLADSPLLDTIGITGSYGKTSVKFYLYTILRAWKETLVTPASFNTPMGIVKTVRGELTPMHRIFLCEMGAKWVGDIKELCDIVHPNHGIITALGEQHLESFGSIENIHKTKYELADALPADGRLYVNFDNEAIRNHPPKHKYITYGTTADCDWRATDITVTADGTQFTVTSPDGEQCRFTTKLLGDHNVLNLTAAIAAAAGFGMKMQEMKLAVRRIEPVKHRMEIVEKNGCTIIDDAFNSNPAGCKAALTTLGRMDGMKILVTPGMVELGEKEEECNRTFGQQAAEVCDFVVLVGEKQSRPILQGLKDKGFADSKIYVTDDFLDGMQKVYGISSEEKKIILLENDLPDNY